ncbi:MAG: hypothetical protein EOP52_10530 [Sphingobacteriales bacterium]|nr:MAG: hypothetical protein EOP52_10530 [Sphingobacteriales bacterium]
MRISILTLTAFSLLACSLPETAHAQRRKKEKAPVVVSIYDADSLKERIPRQRELFHNYIDREQRGVDVSDGQVDGVVYYGEDTAVSQLLTKAMLTDINHLQVMIENLPVPGDMQLQNQTKIRYLTAVRNLLQRYNRDSRIDPYAYRRQVTNLREMIIARQEGKLTEWAQTHATMASIANAELLESAPEAKAYIFRKVGAENPKVMFRRLGEFAQEPYACDIIAAAAQVIPNEVYSFASSTNYKLSSPIRNCQDPTVQAIVKIGSESKKPLSVMPFYRDIASGKRTVGEIDKIVANEDAYYKALVDLRIASAGQTPMAPGSDPFVLQSLKYVRTMNDLHESADATRFRCIDGFSPEQIYYILVNGQDELYTSSYVGAFNRMMERMKGRSGDSLLQGVNYDRFRTFIRLAANYNTLDPFLNTMNKDNQVVLMKSFMNGLEKGPEDDLEDAVDVADAYSSLEDFTLAKLLTAEVESNYERNKAVNNRKGIIVYGLLSALFKGGVEGGELGLPPVNYMPYAALTNDSGIVYQQVYFYGDEDGKVSYQNFLPAFRDGKWKVTSEKYWTRIASTSGKPIVIFANNPLTEPEDEQAQAKLNAYLAEKDIHPTVIIHRGHSYHLPVTLDGLQKETKIVMLGSCGGYHNLGTVIDHSPDAQIISTKQTGTMSVNEPIIAALNTQILAGKDIQWPSMWRGLGEAFAKKGGDPAKRFKDYVPPHKNLGALFIKSYRKLSNASES